MISLVSAIGEGNRVIGNHGEIPWAGQLPRDMKHFQRLTEQRTVAMGRKTWDSLPDRFKPLPNRENVVISRNPDLKIEGARVVGLIDEFLGRGDEILIIGGGEIYELFLPYAERIYLTYVEGVFEGDAFFPEINLWGDWYDTMPAVYRPIDEKNKVACIYRDLRRIDREATEDE